jgi:hypothetical protein
MDITHVYGYMVYYDGNMMGITVPSYITLRYFTVMAILHGIKPSHYPGYEPNLRFPRIFPWESNGGNRWDFTRPWDFTRNG